MDQNLHNGVKTKPSFLPNLSMPSQKMDSKMSVPPLYPFRKPNFNFRKHANESKYSRGETIRAAAQRNVLGKSTLKRFNSSNGIRMLEQSTRDGDEEEEEVKYPIQTRTPIDVQDAKFTGSYLKLAQQVTITPNREVIIKGKGIVP